MNGLLAGAESRTRAPFGRRRAAVLGNRGVGTYRVVSIRDPAPRFRPRSGQFYMLASADRWGAGEGERPYLARAFSVLRAHALDEEGQLLLDFLLEDVGPGTERLCELAPGDELWITGPLGVGFVAPPHGRRAVLAGGGVGIAPLAIWQDELRTLGRPQVTLLGFRDADHAEGAGLLSVARLATDDGSVGDHALVTELLAAELDGDDHATVYACGPPPMLEAVRAMCAARQVGAQLAMEAGMACGYGACFGCVVPTRAGYLRVCVDGPVLDAALLDNALVSGSAAAPAR